MSKRKYAVTLATLLVFASMAQAGRLHPERHYQNQWCQEQGGRAEVVLPDRTRCDCLTDSHAVEVDFGNKWAEAVGQALYYAIQTNRKAGIVLILEKPTDYKYWIRLNTIIEHFNLPIDTWKVGTGANGGEK